MNNANGNIVGETFRGMIFPTLQKVARDFPPVLLTGETGTGKSVVAKHLHSISHRSGESFVAINCGAIPANLVESELFGHERGAFTDAFVKKDGIFTAADKGTLFLDEVGELSLSAQVKLLQVLDKGTFYPIGSTKPLRTNCSVICATNRNLKEMIKRGVFREDLYFRINVVQINIPSMTERIADLPDLLNHFLEKYRNGKELSFDGGALELLTAQRWPGNVREVENFVFKVCIFHDGGVVTSQDAEQWLEVRPGSQSQGPKTEEAVIKALFSPANNLAEIKLIAARAVLELCDGKISEAARILDVSRTGLTALCADNSIGFGREFKPEPDAYLRGLLRLFAQTICKKR